MSFRYDGLWKLLEENEMSKDQFRSRIGASQTTIVKMGRNENVSLDILDRACKVLNCTITDILEYVPDREDNNNLREFKKGEIYLYSRFSSQEFVTDNFKNDALIPILILQNNDWYKITRSALGVLFSSKIERISRSADIMIKADNINNLPMDAIISVDEIRQFRVSKFYDKIGELSQLDMSRIESKYKDLLGI